MADRSVRPLSPHLGVYRLPLLSLVSIITRACALALALGLLVFLTWIITLGLDDLGPGSEAARFFTDLLTSPLGLIALVGWTFALFWHSANGIRHLFWDTGRGLSLPTAERTARVVIAVAFLGTLGTWLVIGNHLL